MTENISIEVPKDLFDQYFAHAQEYGCTEGDGILAFVLEDAKRYRKAEELTLKERFLSWAGYRYCYPHALYVNQRTRKAVNIEFIEQRSLMDDIIQFVKSPADQNLNWLFCFVGGDPSDSVKRELSLSLDLLYPLKS